MEKENVKARREEGKMRGSKTMGGKGPYEEEVYIERIMMGTEDTMASAFEVAKYILKLTRPEWGDHVSNLKLQKLLYYSQGAHLALFGKRLFPEEIQAWEHGPVVPLVYRAYAEVGDQGIPVDYDFDGTVLEESERGVIEEVYEIYGQFSAWKLREMTMGELPWMESFEPFSEVQAISVRSLEEYFKENMLVEDEDEKDKAAESKTPKDK